MTEPRHQQDGYDEEESREESPHAAGTILAARAGSFSLSYSSRNARTHALTWVPPLGPPQVLVEEMYVRAEGKPGV